jgi:hypothetical protein
LTIMLFVGAKNTDKHHNSIGNRSGVIAHLELLIEVLQLFFNF